MGSTSESFTSPLMSKQSTGNEVGKDQVYSSDPSMEIMDHESQCSDSSFRRIPPPPDNSHRPPPRSPPPAEEQVVEHEYGCKYCVKKFSSKQALGGHQNAHKVERTMERTLKEGRPSNFRYLSAGGPSYYPGMNYSSHYNFPASFFNRSPEFFNQATYLTRQEAAGGSMQHALMIYAPTPASNEAYPGNYIQFIPKHDPPASIRYSAPPLALLAPDPPNMNFQGGNNNQQMVINPQLMNQPLVDESGLDLSLRLSTV